MNSAAVIGRQLRQQATTGRTSGPLVPPQAPGKGRPRTPSHVPTSGRPYSPAPASMTGTSGERYNVIPGGGGGGGGGPGATHLNYPSSHPGLHGKEDRGAKGEEPKLKCTWHCFCVALKALSGGLVLFIAGTIMSVVGFVADANHNSTQTLSNDTVIETPLPSVFRNLTFAGPVIMGLGGIVIVAALVLTFEVRDTLGVKVVPAKPTPTTNTNLPPSLSNSNNLHSNKDSIGHGKGGGGGGGVSHGAGSSSTYVGNKMSNSSSSTVPTDQHKEPIPSIASTLSPENRITGQAIDGSLLKKVNLELGLNSNTVTSAKTTAANLSAGIIRSTNNNGDHQTGKESLKMINNSNHQQLPLRNGSGGIGQRGAGGKIKLDPSSLTIPFDVLSDLGPVTGSLHRQRLGDINTETAFNGLLPLDDPLIMMDTGRSAARGKHGNESRAENKVRGGKSHQGYQFQQSTSTGGDAGGSGADLNKQLASFSSGATSLSHVISPNIESYYFALPSPQETELSDPEGCSLTVPARWRSSRCSCSASPTHSMSMELYLDQKDPPINIKIIEQQRIQEQLIIQQQKLLKQQQDQLQRLIEQANLGRHSLPFHRPKVLASIESDGLSSTSSSSDDLFVPLRRSRPSSSTSPFNITNHHHPYQSTSSAPHHHLYHQQQQQQQQQVKSSQQRPTTTYQQQSSSYIGHHQKSSSSHHHHHHHHHHDHQTRPNSGPTTTAANIDEPSSSFGFRSELSSEFSSNASELDSPLQIDLDEDLSKALEKLKSPPTKQLKSKSKDLPSTTTTTTTTTTTKDETIDEDANVKDDETSESTRLLPTTSTSSKAPPIIKLNRPEKSIEINTGDNSISSESTASTTTDKRFPLLREGALSNGSVTNRKR